VLLVLKLAAYTCALAIVGFAAFGLLQPLSDSGRRRLARYAAAAAAVFTAVALVTVALDVSRLLGTPGLPTASQAVLYLKVTSLGRSWAWRTGLTVAVLVILLLFPARRPAWAAAFALSLGALFPVALVSHAAAAPEYRSLFVAVDWFHLISIGLWFGGLVAISLPGVVEREDPAGFAAVVDRFSTLAMIAVPIAIATGAFEMQNTLDEANDLAQFTYGRALLAKHLFLIPILGLAGYTLLGIKPRLKVLKSPELVRKARQNITAEALLVLGMLASTSLLTQEIPPSHIGMAGPDVLREFRFSFSAAFILWAALAAGAGALLLRALFKGVPWVASGALGAAFALFALLAASTQVVTLDRPPFRHSTDPAVIARGAEVYANYCAICHGETGRGDGPLAIGLSSPPADFTKHLYHHSDERVLRWVTNGIPGTQMPPFGEALSLEDRQAVISFLRQLVAEAMLE